MKTLSDQAWDRPLCRQGVASEQMCGLLRHADASIVAEWLCVSQLVARVITSVLEIGNSTLNHEYINNKKRWLGMRDHVKKWKETLPNTYVQTIDNVLLIKVYKCQRQWCMNQKYVKTVWVKSKWNAHVRANVYWPCLSQRERVLSEIFT